MRFFSTGRVLVPALVVVGASIDLSGQADRMPPIAPQALSQAQKEVVANAFGGGAAPAAGPYVAWLRSPVVLSGRKIVGDYLLAYKGALSPKLTEIAILMTARHWTQQYIWHSHITLAKKAGVREDIMAAIADGRRPANIGEDEAVIYDFCDELLRTQSVSDATYARALKHLGGEQGVVEAVAAVGHWASNAMLMNTVRLPLPAGSAAPLKPFPR
jgi:4-carboxymuconolactone decarboxylase